MDDVKHRIIREKIFNVKMELENLYYSLTNEIVRVDIEVRHLPKESDRLL